MALNVWVMKEDLVDYAEPSSTLQRYLDVSYLVRNKTEKTLTLPSPTKTCARVPERCLLNAGEGSRGYLGGLLAGLRWITSEVVRRT